MVFSDDDFRELVKRAISGDEGSINEFCKTITPFLSSYIQSIFGESLQAMTRIEDLLNEVLVKIKESLPNLEYSSAAEFKSWLRKICDSHLRETARFFKAKKRNSQGQVSLNMAMGGEGDSVIELRELLPGSGTTPSGALLRDERGTFVRNILSGLKSEYRSILELKFFKRLSSAEIAEQLGKTPGAVRTMLLRATTEFTKRFREIKKHIDPDSTVFK